MSALNDAQFATSVVVRPAQRSERALLEGLFQFYAYDFSEFARESAGEFHLDGRGRFPAYPYMESYFEAEDRWALLFVANEQPAGFALINSEGHSGREVDRNMAEFFVARRFRRNGLATHALHQVLRMHTGVWEAAVAETNKAALVFWPRALAAAANVSELTEVPGDGAHWRGPIMRFRASPIP